MLCRSFRLLYYLLTLTYLSHSFDGWYPPSKYAKPDIRERGSHRGVSLLSRGLETLLVGTLLVVGQGRVEEVHVGLILFLGVLEELLRHGPVGLGLLPVLPVEGVEHVLCEARVPLLQGHCVVENLSAATSALSLLVISTSLWRARARGVTATCPPHTHQPQTGAGDAGRRYFSPPSLSFLSFRGGRPVYMRKKTSTLRRYCSSASAQKSR